jgi:hypothetical protein
MVFSQIPVYGRGAYLFQFFRRFPGEVKGRPLGDSVHLLPHKRGKDFVETSFLERLYRKNVQIRRGAAMSVSV